VNRTSRMQFPYPSRNQEPYFDIMESFFLALDAATYAAREDRHLIFQEGGPILFVAGTGVLSWGSDIEILAPITGFQWVIAAGQITLDDGQLFYVELPRAPSGNTAITPTVASQVPSSNLAMIVGVRRGNKVYLRNGVVLLSDLPAYTIAAANSGDGSITRYASTASATLSGASTDIEVDIPSGAKIISCALNVDITITGSGASAWDAAYTGGASQSIASSKAFTQNTKQTTPFDVNAATDIASAETDVRITPDAGTFTGGSIRAVVIYDVYSDLADV
jgi:hypothetical protein